MDIDELREENKRLMLKLRRREVKGLLEKALKLQFLDVFTAFKSNLQHSNAQKFRLHKLFNALKIDKDSK